VDKDKNKGNEDWALILGASSGFGEAVGLELARAGMNIVGIHLDRKSTLPNVERIVQQIQSEGRPALFFNANAAATPKISAQSSLPLFLSLSTPHLLHP